GLLKWRSRQTRVSRGRRGLESLNRHVLNGIAARGEEALEVGERDHERGRVDVRVEGDAAVGLQIAIEANTDVMRGVVNESKRRHRSRRHTEVCHQPLRRSETELAVADLVRDSPEIR